MKGTDGDTDHALREQASEVNRVSSFSSLRQDHVHGIRSTS